MKKNMVWLVAGLLSLPWGCSNKHVVKQTGFQSPHYKAVSDRLDLGGQVFVYVDIEGDAEKGAEFVDDILKKYKKDIRVDALQKLNVVQIVKMLGLDQVKAFGLSSYRDGNVFRNRAFIRKPGEPKGLTRMLSRPARAFEIARKAPADTDIAFEADLQLKTLYEVVAQVLREVMGEQAEQWLHVVHSPIGKLSLSYIQLIEKLDTRLVGMLRVNAGKHINIPGAEFSFPHTEVLLGIDDLGIVFDELIKLLGKVPFVKITEEGDWHFIESAMPMPGDLSLYNLVLAKQKSTQRLFFATSRALLESYFDEEKPTLQAAAEFKTAMKGLPTEGNSLHYMSPRFTAVVKEFLVNLSKAYPDAGEGVDLVSALLPQSDLAVASVRKNLPDGVFIASNSSSSHKTTLLGLSYGGTAFLGGVVAAVVVPAYMEYQQKADSLRYKEKSE